MTRTARFFPAIALALLVLTGAGAPQLAAQEDHGDENALKMNPAERQTNGVKTARITRRALIEEVIVPGEVTLDLYRTSQITPRISAQIMARHAKLGDKVTRGQPLVTLSSVDMADAQGTLIVANREWNRVRKLGRNVVSERRFVEAQVAAQQAKAKVLAFGMTPKQVAALLKQSDTSKATGTFTLLAPQDGTILADNFIVGEFIEPGRVLMQLGDESQVWIEAQLAPDQAVHVSIGSPARILIDGEHKMTGTVIQVHHRLDETTRTLPVRIVVDNQDDELHSGEYVNVAIKVGAGAPVLALPESATILMEGATSVFRLEGDEFHPTPIKTGPNRGGWVEVTGGLSEGDEIATSRVFLLKSLILKSKMGEGHGH
jgi:cobalt-zinc-cadmium efflux system membrane fusion protein